MSRERTREHRRNLAKKKKKGKRTGTKIQQKMKIILIALRSPSRGRLSVTLIGGLIACCWALSQAVFGNQRSDRGATCRRRSSASVSDLKARKGGGCDALSPTLGSDLGTRGPPALTLIPWCHRSVISAANSPGVCFPKPSLLTS